MSYPCFFVVNVLMKEPEINNFVIGYCPDLDGIGFIVEDSILYNINGLEVYCMKCHNLHLYQVNDNEVSVKTYEFKY